MRLRPMVFTGALSLALIVSLPAFAQKPPGGGGGGGGGTGGSGGGNTRGSVAPMNPMSNNTIQVTAPLIYNGRVLVEGAPLTDAVKVIARCSGNKNKPMTVYQTYTDMKGQFSFTVGSQEGALPDASVDTASNDLMFQANNTMQLTMCEITASAPGFMSSQMNVQFRSSLENSEIGRLVLTPIGGGTDLGGIVSVTTLSAPDNAQREYSNGMKELRNKKIDKAEKHFEKAVSEYPKFAVAWHKLGLIQADEHKKDAARESMKHAIDADPKFVPPLIDLARIEGSENKWTDVASITGRAIEVDPKHFPDAYFMAAVANFNLGKVDEAEKLGLKAEDIDKENRFPRIHLLLAQLYSAQKKNDAAAGEFKKYLAIDSKSKDAEAARQQLAKLETPKP